MVHEQVEITGVDSSGLQFTERARLVDVGGLGCRLLARNVLQQGGILGIEPLGPRGQNLPDEFPRLFVIVRVLRKGELWEAGARCLLEDELTDSSFHASCAEAKSSPE